MKRLDALVIAVLTMIFLTGFPCSGYGETIRGCYQKNNGQLRIVGANEGCRPSEVPISWAGASEIPGPATIMVDCSKGETIADALQQPGSPMTIEIEGACSENVVIARDDVTLLGNRSTSAINGIDPTLSTITVRSDRTVIHGLTITGGSIGIDVRGDVTIQDCIVKDTGSAGILFPRGTSGTVDKCTIQNSGRQGIYLEGGSANITNNTISSNKSVGIKVVGGFAKIGILPFNMTFAKNTITNNGGGGIQIAFGGGALIGGNDISGNGTTEPGGQFGIAVMYASADIVGGNYINNNPRGVWAVGSTVAIGDRGMQLSNIANNISQNGSNFPNLGFTGDRGGIIASLGSSLTIWNATVDQNTGNGVLLDNRSTALISGGTISNNYAVINVPNTGNGILLATGASLVLPGTAATGNASFDLQCLGGESCFTGNTSGMNVSGGCKGF